MKLFKTNLKFRLLAFFFLLGIPVLIIGIIITYYNGSQNLKESIGKRFQEIAEQTAERASFFINYEFQKLHYLSGNQKLIDEVNTINNIKEDRIREHPYGKRISADLLSMLNQFMRNNKDIYKKVIISDKMGRTIASTNEKDEDNYKDKEWWWMTAYNGIANISDFYTREGSYTSTGSIEFFVDVAVPIIDWREAEVVGVIKGTLSGEWITRTVVNSWIGKSGHTMLVTSDGLVAICPLELLEGAKDLHKMDDSMMRSLKGLASNGSKWTIVKDNTHGGKNAIAGFVLIKLSPDIHKIEKQTSYIFVTQDPSETYAPLYYTLLKTLTFGLFLIIVFSIGSYYIAQRIVKPLAILKDGAEALGKSNANIILPVLSDDEIGQLTQSFNTMAAAIKERTDESQRKGREWDNTFNSITDLVVIYDKNYIIIKVNKAFAQRFNASPEAVIGKMCFDVFPKSGTNWVIGFRGASESGEIFQEEVYDPDTGVTFMVTIFPWLHENGQIAGSVLVARDITEYKNLQAQLLHSEKLVAVGELASGVAHELNNPLTGIMGFTELLLQKEKDEKKRDILTKMLNAAERSAKIIQNLLLFVRKSKEEDMPIEVNNMILNTLELKAQEFKVNDIVIIKKLAPSPPKIKGNYHQLQQVILNILNNAHASLLEANRAGKEILIETKLKDIDGRGEVTSPLHILEISIKDNGLGIPPENLSKIFNPFFTTKQPGKGTGLGLSVSYGIIKRHNGRIYAKSDLGEGAAFYIELPVFIG